MPGLDVKGSLLPPDGGPTTDDLMITIDLGTGTTKRITLAQLASLVSQNLDAASVESSNIDFTTFSGTRLPDYSSETQVNVATSTAVTDLLLYTAAVDSFLTCSIFGVGTGAWHIRVGNKATVTDNRVHYGNSIVAGQEIIRFSTFVPAGMKVYMTRPAAPAANHGIYWYPLKSS